MDKYKDASTAKKVAAWIGSHQYLFSIGMVCFGGGYALLAAKNWAELLVDLIFPRSANWDLLNDSAIFFTIGKYGFAASLVGSTVLGLFRYLGTV